MSLLGWRYFCHVRRVMIRRTASRLVGLDADRPSTRTEIMIGGLLAYCAHPVLAWRVLSPSGRLVVCGGYAMAAYVSMLMLLLLARPSAF